MEWILRNHAGYEKAVANYVYVDDVYTGKARDKALAAAERLRGAALDLGKPLSVEHKTPPAALPTPAKRSGLGEYLFRRARGEHPENFVERAGVTRFPRVLQHLTAGFAGDIIQVGGEAVYEWGVMGYAGEPGTDAHALWRDANGAGANWQTIASDVLVYLVLHHETFYAVQPPLEDGGLPRWSLLETASVVNYRKENGLLVELVVEEEITVQATLADDPGMERHRIHYHAGGWDRYRITRGEDGAESADRIEEQSGTWERPYVSRAGQPRIPFGCASLPLRYHAGLRAAQANVDLYNHLSDVRNLIRVANHPRLRGKDLETQEFTTTMEQMAEGANVMMGDWDFIGPDPSNATAAHGIYEKEYEHTYNEALDQYTDAARYVATAREVEEKSRSRTAFLSLVTTALEEVENDVLFLMSQQIAPASRLRWPEATVERSRNFRSQDPDVKEATRRAAVKEWLDMSLTLDAAMHRAGYSKEEIAETLETNRTSATLTSIAA